MEATTAKEGNLSKRGKKMDSGSFLKVEPTKEEMHAVTVRVLKRVDFNTTRLSDINEHLCFHFGVDLMHREVEMKSIITDVINNMNDEEDEGDEAKESIEAGGDAENDEDDDDGGKIETPAKRKRSDDSDNDEDQEDDDNMQEVVQSDGGPLVQSVDDDDDEDDDDKDDDDEGDDYDDDATEADEEDMGTEYLIKSVGYAKDEEDACVFEPEENGEKEEWRAEMKEEINEDLDLLNKGSILKFGEEKEVEDDDERYANGDFYEGPWERNLQDGQRRYIWKNGNEYVGEWKNGMMSRRGVLIWANGNRYDIQWENGVPEGNGVFTWSDGSYYVGNWDMKLQQLNGTFYPGCGKELSSLKGNGLFMGENLTITMGKRCMVFAGSTLVNGNCICLVTRTGMETKIGKVHSQIQAASQSKEDTLLKKKLLQENEGWDPGIKSMKKGENVFFTIFPKQCKALETM